MVALAAVAVDPVLRVQAQLGKVMMVVMVSMVHLMPAAVVVALDQLVVMRQALAAAMEDLERPLPYQAQVYLMPAVAGADQDQVEPLVQLQRAAAQEALQQMQHQEQLIPAAVAAVADGMARYVTQVTVVLE